MKPKKNRLFRDVDALAYRPNHTGDEGGAINHIRKEKRRAKGVEVTFDPAAHRLVLFVRARQSRRQRRRRKQQRRKRRRAAATS